MTRFFHIRLFVRFGRCLTSGLTFLWPVVTETFRDGFGRVTETVRCVWKNGARDPASAPLETRTEYPRGVCDYRVTTDASISALGEDRPVVIEDALAFIVGPDESVELTPLTLARTFLEETRCYWQDWLCGMAPVWK